MFRPLSTGSRSSRAAQDLQEFYRAVHGVVGELMDASNFFIALYDEERQLINWPYYVTRSTTTFRTPTNGMSSARAMRGVRPRYVLRTGEPQLSRTSGCTS